LRTYVRALTHHVCHTAVLPPRTAEQSRTPRSSSLRHVMWQITVISCTPSKHKRDRARIHFLWIGERLLAHTKIIKTHTHKHTHTHTHNVSSTNHHLHQASGVGHRKNHAGWNTQQLHSFLCTQCLHEDIRQRVESQRIENPDRKINRLEGLSSSRGLLVRQQFRPHHINTK